MALLEHIEEDSARKRGELQISVPDDLLAAAISDVAERVFLSTKYRAIVRDGLVRYRSEHSSHPVAA
jgi:hypothetical protein